MNWAVLVGGLVFVVKYLLRFFIDQKFVENIFDLTDNKYHKDFAIIILAIVILPTSGLYIFQSIADILVFAVTEIIFEWAEYMFRDIFKLFRLEKPNKFGGEEYDKNLITDKEWKGQAKFLRILFGVSIIITILLLILDYIIRT